MSVGCAGGVVCGCGEGRVGGGAGAGVGGDGCGVRESRCDNKWSTHKLMFIFLCS